MANKSSEMKKCNQELQYFPLGGVNSVMPVTLGAVYHLVRGHFEWEIDDFLSFTNIRSPTFKFNGTPFYLETSVNYDMDKLELRVRKKNVSPCKFHVKLEMGTGYGGKHESRRGITNGCGSFCVLRWMPLAELLARRLEILPNGRLKVTCKLQEYSNTVPVPNKRLDSKETNKEGKETDDEGEEIDDEDEETDDEGEEIDDEDEETDDEGEETNSEDEETNSKECVEEKNESSDSDEDKAIPQPKSFKKVQEALKNLLISGEDSDVTIKVQGKEFPAHRGILRARSAVFKSMFTHNMLEKESGIVLIDDCDPVTFLDFLNHVYTGSTDHISIRNVFSLYAVSDKYDMEDLKEECLTFMESNLNVDTFCDIIVLALKHSETELIQLATKFFCGHTSEIVETTKWKAFLMKHSTEGNELFIKFLTNREMI